MVLKIPSIVDGIRDVRNKTQSISYDEISLRKQRLEFYLLTSLGTRVMFKWLPSNYILAPNAKTIELGGSTIVIRSHLPSLSPWMQRFRQENQEFSKTIRQLRQMVITADDALRIMKSVNGNEAINDNFYKQSQLLESLSTLLEGKIRFIAGQAPRAPLFVGDSVEAAPSASCNPIFDAYRRANPIFVDDMAAIERLEDIFYCKGESVWSPVQVDRRSNWRQKFINLGGGIPLCVDNGTIALSLASSLQHRTVWSRIGDRRDFFLSVVTAPLPLWHPQEAAMASELALTEDLGYAVNSRYTVLGDRRTPTSSWIGGADSIPYANWQSLKNKRVKYLLHCGEKKYLETAAKIKNVLTGIASEVTFWGVLKYINPDHDKNDFTQLDPHSFERLLGAKISDYPVTLYDRNKTEKRKPSVSPYFVVTDTDAKSTRPIQSPFPIAEGSISLIFSKPGIGKTWFAMCYAYALSLGKSFCAKWTSNKKLTVLYIDGEMGENGLKDRLQHIERIYGVKMKDNKNFHCLALNVANIDLSSIEGQNEIDKYISKNIYAHGKKELLIVIDNILSVTRYSDHSAHWNSVFGWVKDLRDNDKVTVIFVHHTAKDEEKQRGTEIKTAVVDNVIKIEEPKQKKDAIDIKLSFTKHRFIAYNDHKEFNLTLKLHIGNPRWIDHGKYSTVKNLSLLKQLLTMLGTEEPLPIKALMEDTGYSRPAIYQHYAKLFPDRKKNLKKTTKDPLI